MKTPGLKSQIHAVRSSALSAKSHKRDKLNAAVATLTSIALLKEKRVRLIPEMVSMLKEVEKEWGKSPAHSISEINVWHRLHQLVKKLK